VNSPQLNAKNASGTSGGGHSNLKPQHSVTTAVPSPQHSPHPLHHHHTHFFPANGAITSAAVTTPTAYTPTNQQQQQQHLFNVTMMNAPASPMHLTHQPHHHHQSSLQRNNSSTAAHQQTTAPTTQTANPPHQLVSTTNSSTSSYSYNPNGTVEEYLIETHLIEPSLAAAATAATLAPTTPVIVPRITTTSGSGCLTQQLSTEIQTHHRHHSHNHNNHNHQHQQQQLSPEDDEFMMMMPPAAAHDDPDPDLELFFDKKTRRRQRLKLKREQQQQHLDEDEKIVFCTHAQITYAIASAIILAFLLAFPQFFAYEIRQNVVSVSPSRLPEPPLPSGADDKDAAHVAMSDFSSQYANIYFIEEDRPAAGITSAAASWFYGSASGGGDLNHDSLSYTRSVCKALGFSVKINADDATSRRVYAQMRKTHNRFFSFKEYFRLVTNQYDYCNMLKNSRPPGATEQAVNNLATMNKVIVMLSEWLLFTLIFFLEFSLRQNRNKKKSRVIL
jgi:hypothetical protein